MKNKLTDLNKKILNAIEDNDPLAFGDILVSDQSVGVTITGKLHTALDKPKLVKIIQKVVEEIHPGRSVHMAIETPRRGLRVREKKGKVITEATNRRREKKPLDEMEIIYCGMMKTSEILENSEFKKVNHETFQKVLDPIRVLKFFTPVVLDKNYKVIDGNMRLRIALNEEIDEIPVIVVNDDGIKSDFLRLVLNRSTEFQRWNWSEVDNFVDSIPQAQPLLEPLGFFGDKILPTSFFAKTVLNYKIDEFNDQQKKYSQDIGLAEWAKIQRRKHEREERLKLDAKKKKSAPKDAVALFSLKPEAKDFTPTYEAQKEIVEHTEEWKEVAGEITENYDAVMKAKREEAGKEWQTTRRTSQQLADHKRAEAKKKKKKD